MSEETNEQGAGSAETNSQAVAPAAGLGPSVVSADLGAGAPIELIPKWTPMELVDGVAVPVVPAPAGVHLLDRARALEELAKGEAAELIDEGIQAFKDIEGRTMRVVHRLGQLFKQEVNHGE